MKWDSIYIMGRAGRFKKDSRVKNIGAEDSGIQGFK